LRQPHAPFGQLWHGRCEAGTKGLLRETHANENRACRRRAQHGIRSAPSGATTGGRPASRNGWARFLKAHSWEEYTASHLGLTEGAAEETKARYAFVYGDFRRLHRMGLIACHYRAAEWRHKEIELAAHELLQYLDRKSASGRGSAARLGRS